MPHIRLDRRIRPQEHVACMREPLRFVCFGHHRESMIYTAGFLIECWDQAFASLQSCFLIAANPNAQILFEAHLNKPKFSLHSNCLWLAQQADPIRIVYQVRTDADEYG